MKLKIKLLILALSASIIQSVIPVYADTQTVSNLVNQAIQQKSFYSYNNAYSEVMKLSDENEKSKLLKQLSTIENQVFSNDIKNIVKSIDELSKTGSGKIYDEVQVTINKANITDVDRNYLLEEVCSWGKQLVWTDDYKSAVNTLVKAWTDKTPIAIENAQRYIEYVDNEYSKAYLKEELAKIESIVIEQVNISSLSIDAEKIKNITIVTYPSPPTRKIIDKKEDIKKLVTYLNSLTLTNPKIQYIVGWDLYVDIEGEEIQSIVFLNDTICVNEVRYQVDKGALNEIKKIYNEMDYTEVQL